MAIVQEKEPVPENVRPIVLPIPRKRIRKRKNEIRPHLKPPGLLGRLQPENRSNI